MDSMDALFKALNDVYNHLILIQPTGDDDEQMRKWALKSLEHTRTCLKIHDSMKKLERGIRQYCIDHPINKD